jgi:hypothetical protein
LSIEQEAVNWSSLSFSETQLFFFEIDQLDESIIFSLSHFLLLQAVCPVLPSKMNSNFEGETSGKRRIQGS